MQEIWDNQENSSTLRSIKYMANLLRTDDATIKTICVTLRREKLIVNVPKKGDRFLYNTGE